MGFCEGLQAAHTGYALPGAPSPPDAWMVSYISMGYMFPWDPHFMGSRSNVKSGMVRWWTQEGPPATGKSRLHLHRRNH